MARAAARSRPLLGVTVIGNQHLQGSTGGLARALAAAGAAPKDIWFQGKVYSDMHNVISELIRDGFNMSKGGMIDLTHPDYDQAWIWRYLNVKPETLAVSSYHPQSLLQKIPVFPIPGGRYLVYDDGGQLLRYLNDHVPNAERLFVGVEQTRKGANELRKIQLKFPVINVAESWGKLTYESPMIGRAVGNSFVETLDRVRAQGIDPGRSVVLRGYGAVGEAVARDLRRRGYAVAVHDTSPAALDRARRAGFAIEPSLEAALAQAHILVSGTGTEEFQPAHYELLPDGAIVMNAASGNSELPATKQLLNDPERRLAEGSSFRHVSRFRGVTFDLGPGYPPPLQDQILRTPGGKEILRVKGGYVVS
jgi:S-adenosylhomocysteine hydrolase